MGREGTGEDGVKRKMKESELEKDKEMKEGVEKVT